MSEQLSINLEGSDQGNLQQVRLDDLTMVCDRLNKALRQIERSVFDRRPVFVYSICELSTGSANVTLEEQIESGKHEVSDESPFRVFKKAMCQIAAGELLDSRIDWMALEHMKELVRPVSRGTAKSLVIHGLSIGPWFSNKIDEILKDVQEARGSVKGRLEKINIHSEPQFHIYPRVGTKYIKCRFKQAMLQDVRNAIGRDVTVFGKLQTMRGRLFPMSATVDRLEIHPSNDELPTLLSLKGMAKGQIPNSGGVAAIRAIRDAQEKEIV